MVWNAFKWKMNDENNEKFSNNVITNDGFLSKLFKQNNKINRGWHTTIS